jgi:hypothetical protein
VTGTNATEAPAEPVPPAPEAAAATAPPAEPEVESEDNRTARQKVLDFLEDTEGEQTVAQIIQGTGLSRNTCEQAIFRAVQSEQLQRVSQGVYRLASPKPPSPPKPEPPSRNGHTNDEWIARILAWQADPASWNIEEDGPPPNDPNHRIPLDVVGRFKDRQAREAKEREKREAAAARQAAADAELRDQLLAATGGNYTPGPGIEDISPIKVALELVPLDRILSVIRWKVDKVCYPKNPPLTSWRDRKLLKAIGEYFCEAIIIPSMIDAWSKAGKASASSLPVRDMPDNDIDRSHHDSEHAPPGPHSLPNPSMRGRP